MGNEGNEMEMETVRGWIKKLSSFDHRRAERLESPLLVAYYWDGSVPVGHEIRDISSSGFYLVTTERWHPGTVVTMTLQRSDIVHRDVNGDNYISVLSRVVRPGEDGVGFAFVPLETKGSRKKDVSPRSRPVGRKALYRFLERLNLDQGRPAIESNCGNEKEVLVGQDASLEMPGEKVMKTLRDESGQSLVLAAFAMACLMGFVALAADVGMMFRERRLAQTAADSASIAGAAELNFGDFSTAAQAAAAQNGFTNNANGATVTVNGPPTGPASGPHAGNTAYVEVIVSQSQPTFFMNVFGRSSMTVTGRAVATSGPGTGCMYTLGTSGASLTFGGSDTVSIANCGIIDNSNLSVGGSTTIDALSIGVAGRYFPGGSDHVSPAPIQGIVPSSDPLASLTAPSVNLGSLSCAANPNIPGSTTKTLSPTAVGGVACYSGITTGGSDNITINNPGVLVINGDFSIGGSNTMNLGSGLYYITGNVTAGGSSTVNGGGANGITIYEAGGGLNLGGSTVLNLVAPTSGPENGIVFWQAQNDSQPVTLGGSATSNIRGVIYAPKAAVTLGGSNASNIYADFVVSSLTLGGSVTLHDYAALAGTTSPITSIRLVE
jgi:Flp pilus assembly protein TadG